EVSRSLAACEGAILVVDATQGIEAQTLANLHLALDNNLKIIPVINKIDLPAADPEKVTSELVDLIGFEKDEIILCSAKTGEGIEELLDAVVNRIPAPVSTSDKFRALIFDSYFDSYKGIVTLIRVVDGSISVGDKIKMLSNDKVYEVLELGKHTPREKSLKTLSAGEVGYLSGSIKSIEDVRVGDTISKSGEEVSRLPGYKEMKPMVFSGLYPIDSSKYNNLKEALQKLKLNDSALTFEPETSTALGFGFRCGFLGLLHMEIIEERLEREFMLDIITTAPSVSYIVNKTNGEQIVIDNPSKLPPMTEIDSIEEPIVKAFIYSPPNFVGPIMDLCQQKRGIYKNLTYIDTNRVKIDYTIPLSEIVYDFFDNLKSRTKGYASLDYEFDCYKKDDLIKLDFLLNGDVCDALSIILHRENAYQRGRQIAEKLKDVIPRQLFEIPIQAAIGNKVIARETVKALRKDVLAKCYGGDITRKKKLLEKQKEGKKRMRQIGNVEIPSEAFMSILKFDDDQ
ncbi:MAG: translation elongation factor 4, partial [Clostridia bacterium]|nr:translation elongation factor 4 [Clostridia bacterium]